MTPEWEESRLGEESLEEGSDDSEYGEIGLTNGDTPKTSVEQDNRLQHIDKKHNATLQNATFHNTKF